MSREAIINSWLKDILQSTKLVKVVKELDGSTSHIMTVSGHEFILSLRETNLRNPMYDKEKIVGPLTADSIINQCVI